MAGLYQEGKRFPMYEEGKRFPMYEEGKRIPTGDVPPPTMADYLRFLETRKRLSSMPSAEGGYPGLESASMPPLPNGEIWRGLGQYGEQAFTNIPERAQAMGLRETMPPVPEGGYIESLPPSSQVPEGRSFLVEAPQAQAGGEGRSYADKIRARQKLEAHVQQNNIPIAEAMKMQQYWGVDNDSLDKAQKAEQTKIGPVQVILPSGQPIMVPPKEALKYATAEEGRKQRQSMFDETIAYKKNVTDRAMNLKSRLEPTLLKDVTAKEQIISRYEDLVKNFDKNFAGKMVFGPLGTAIYERTGGEPERVDWWKQFKTLDAVLRHDLFGATLTPNEKEAWDAITINENTDSNIAANQLTVRNKIIVDNLSRNLDKYEASGRNVSGLRAQPASATATMGGGGRVKVVSPDGKVGTIPESQLEQAMGKGYKRSQ